LYNSEVDSENDEDFESDSDIYFLDDNEELNSGNRTPKRVSKREQKLRKR
jgi:hypothetical protein